MYRNGNRNKMEITAAFPLIKMK